MKLAPVPAYQDYWAVPVKQKPEDVSLDDKIGFLMKINEAALKVPGVIRVQSNMAFDYEWKYLATSEGSYIEQEIWRTSPGFTVTALKNGKAKSRTFSVAPKSAGYEVVLEAKMLENVERIANEAVEHCTAPPVGVGLKDLIMTPAHAMLTIHEIVAHPTELDRIVGYEANYAGTSFVKASDVGKLMMGSKLFNVTCDRTLPGGMCTVGYDDDGVKSQRWPIIQEGRLVDLQTNRETAHYIGQTASKGCTFATSWRNYPFLRMPNVHVEPGPPGSPTPEQIIADTKDGILIDGRGSYSIDQQRFNGQFGGDAFWEIKDGKKTRMLSDVTYNAITTDFWQNLDATSGKESWEMFGTTGDAKGQPVQINHPSHGSPWVPHPPHHGRRGVQLGCEPAFPHAANHSARRRCRANHRGDRSREENDRYRHLPLRSRSHRRGAHRGRRARRRRACPDRAHQSRWRGQAAQARDRLLKTGATLSRTADDMVRYHGKLLVIDGTRAYALGFNYTRQDIEKSRSFGLITRNPQIVRDIVKVIDADHDRKEFEISSARVVVSPENARERLAEFIKRTKRELLIYDTNISDDNMIAVLKDRAEAGVKIRVLGKVEKKWVAELTWRVRPFTTMKLHVRCMIRDRKVAFVGSQSLRKLELDHRREVGLITKDPRTVRRMAAVFEQDWKKNRA